MFCLSLTPLHTSINTKWVWAGGFFLGGEGGLGSLSFIEVFLILPSLYI